MVTLLDLHSILCSSMHTSPLACRFAASTGTFFGQIRKIFLTFLNEMRLARIDRRIAVGRERDYQPRSAFEALSGCAM